MINLNLFLDERLICSLPDSVQVLVGSHSFEFAGTPFAGTLFLPFFSLSIVFANFSVAAHFLGLWYDLRQSSVLNAFEALIHAS